MFVMADLLRRRCGRAASSREVKTRDDAKTGKKRIRSYPPGAIMAPGG
jgi:hypothetical protein